MELITSVKALIVTQLFYVLFGGYALGREMWYLGVHWERLGLLAVLWILFIVSSALYLWGVRWGFVGVMALSFVHMGTVSPLIAQAIAAGETLAGEPLGALIYLHWFLLNAFPVLIIILAYRAYRET